MTGIKNQIHTLKIAYPAAVSNNTSIFAEAQLFSRVLALYLESSLV